MKGCPQNFPKQQNPKNNSHNLLPKNKINFNTQHINREQDFSLKIVLCQAAGFISNSRSTLNKCELLGK